MSSNPKVLMQTKYLEAAETTQYTSPASGKGTRVDDATFANRTGAPVSLIVRVVPVGGTAGPEHELQPSISIPAGGTHVMPPFWLGPGDFVRTLPGAANSIVGRMGGREFAS